jgi:glycosyltransferase involved in cell wall biosynthesis
MSRPTLALCVPAYCAEEHLPRLLATAREQVPPFDEIIVCVDASPDRTAEVAQQLGVKVLVNEQNLGCSMSKNRALTAATADWVHFHDADDVLLSGFTTEAHR